MDILPSPEVVRCFFTKDTQPVLSAMELHWDADVATSMRTWYLPQNVQITGAPPRCFGVHIRRHETNIYAVRVLWNELSLGWDNLKRVQILSSALNTVLKSLGTDLWHLLEQPVEQQERLAA